MFFCQALLGAIEAVLERHPIVGQAVALARAREGEESPGRAADMHLVAYIVPTAGGPLTASELRAFLREALPDYMIPSHFVMLDELPLTASGKVDRRALPKPDYVRPDLEQVYVTPRNALETRLTEIWEDVLGLGRIGVHDSFFELGGHSLMATRLVSRIRDAFGVDLPLRTLFETPTIADLANALGAMDWTAGRPELRTGQHTGRREEGIL